MADAIIDSAAHIAGELAVKAVTQVAHAVQERINDIDADDIKALEEKVGQVLHDMAMQTTDESRTDNPAHENHDIAENTERNLKVRRLGPYGKPYRRKITPMRAERNISSSASPFNHAYNFTRVEQAHILICDFCGGKTILPK